jgi:hypothetical protein
MSWEAVSGISQIFATIAVALTVVYLALQIRKNTLATQSQAHYETTIALAETAAAIASSGELTRVYRIGLTTPDQLDEDSYFRFAMIATSQFRTFENLFYQYRSGLVTDDFWSAHRENILWFFHRPGMQVWWQEKRLAYTKSFREFLEDSDPAALASPDDRRL